MTACILVLLCWSTLCVSEASTDTLYLLSYADSEESVSLLISSTSTSSLSIVNQKTESLSLNIAAELAVDLINNRSDILPGYKLELLKKEGGCTTFNYVSFFQDLLYSNRKIVGIVGPGCSESSYAVGIQIARPDLSMISVGLSSTLQTGVLTNSFSLLNPIDYAHALLKMIEKNRWTRLFAVYDITSNYSVHIFNHFVTNLPKNVNLNHQPLHNSTINFDPIGEDRECIDNPRVFIIIAGSSLTTGILCWFHTGNYTFPYTAFQFVLVGRVMDEIVNSAIACNSSMSVRDQLNGAIFLRHKLNTTTSTTVSGLSFEQFTNEYSERINQHNSSSLDPSFYGAFYFDAVWTQVLALNATMGNGFNLSKYHYGNTDFSNKIRENLLSLNFTGVSGEVKFNETTRFVDRTVDIYQVRSSSMQRLEYYDSLEDRIHTYGDDSINYIDSKFKAVSARMVLGIVMLVVFTLLAFGLIALQIMTLAYKNHPSIKATSPKVHFLSYIGCYVILIGCVLKTVGNCFHLSSINNPCLIDHWSEFVIGIGSTLLFASLTSVTFRMYRIFVCYMHPGRFIEDSWLITFTVVMTAIFTVCSIFEYSFSKGFPETETQCIRIIGEIMTVKIVCKYNLVYFSSRRLSLFIPLGLTVLACVFSVLSNRKITISKFKTTSVTILSFIFFLTVAFWTLLFMLSLPETPDYDVIIATNTILICSCIILLYIPPALPIFKQWFKGWCCSADHVQPSPKPLDNVHSPSMSMLKLQTTTNLQQK